MRNTRSNIALVAATFLAAVVHDGHAEAHPSTAAPTAAAHAPAAIPYGAPRTGWVQRYSAEPGQRTGVILDDGIVLAPAPWHTAALLNTVAPGDPVRVALRADGTLDVANRRTGRVVNIGPPATERPVVARGGGPGAGTRLVAVSDRVAMVTRDARGQVRGLVTAGGAQVNVAPAVADVLENVRPGQALEITGRGGAGPDGATVLTATTVRTSDGRVLLDMARGAGTAAE